MLLNTTIVMTMAVGTAEGETVLRASLVLCGEEQVAQAGDVQVAELVCHVALLDRAVRADPHHHMAIAGNSHVRAFHEPVGRRSQSSHAVIEPIRMCLLQTQDFRKWVWSAIADRAHFVALGMIAPDSCRTVRDGGIHVS